MVPKARKHWKLGGALALALMTAASAPGQAPGSNEAAANNGISIEQGREAGWYLADHQRLAAALATLKPQRSGVVDAYIVSVGMDGDPVFGREAGEAARVLSRRYDGAGRTLVLSAGSATAPAGSPSNLAAALAAIAGRMDRKEDVLILYATTHGTQREGLIYKDGLEGFGMIAPPRLAQLIDGLGISRRMVILSACFSGVFLPPLQTEDSVIVTAASFDRASFGCAPSNDWTFFGDALINHGLRNPQPLDRAVAEAFRLIDTWESGKGLDASQPQVFIGDDAKAWVAALEKRMPSTVTPRVGRPAVEN